MDSTNGTCEVSVHSSLSNVRRQHKREHCHWKHKAYVRLFNIKTMQTACLRTTCTPQMLKHYRISRK